MLPLKPPLPGKISRYGNTLYHQSHAHRPEKKAKLADQKRHGRRGGRQNTWTEWVWWGGRSYSSCLLPPAWESRPPFCRSERRRPIRDWGGHPGMLFCTPGVLQGDLSVEYWERPRLFFISRLSFSPLSHETPSVPAITPCIITFLEYSFSLFVSLGENVYLIFSVCIAYQIFAAVFLCYFYFWKKTTNMWIFWIEREQLSISMSWVFIMYC